MVEFVFDTASWLVSMLGFFVQVFLELALDTLGFPNYLKYTDYDDAFVYLDKVAVSERNLFLPIHQCLPNVVTTVV